MSKNGKKKKAGKKTDLVPQEHGGAIYQGPPANPVAGPGRPPNEFKRKMQELASDDEALAYLEKCLKGGEGAKAAISAHKHVTERGYGKAAQDVNATVTHRLLVVADPADLGAT